MSSQPSRDRTKHSPDGKNLREWNYDPLRWPTGVHHALVFASFRDKLQKHSQPRAKDVRPIRMQMWRQLPCDRVGWHKINERNITAENGSTEILCRYGWGTNDFCRNKNTQSSIGRLDLISSSKKIFKNRMEMLNVLSLHNYQSVKFRQFILSGTRIFCLLINGDFSNKRR